MASQAPWASVPESCRSQPHIAHFGWMPWCALGSSWAGACNRCPSSLVHVRCLCHRCGPSSSTFGPLWFLRSLLITLSKSAAETTLPEVLAALAGLPCSSKLFVVKIVPDAAFRVTVGGLRGFVSGPNGGPGLLARLLLAEFDCTSPGSGRVTPSKVVMAVSAVI